MLKKLLLVVIISLIFFLGLTPISFAQAPSADETLEAVIVNVVEEKELEVMESKQLYQKLEALVTQGSLKDKKIIIESGLFPSANLPKYLSGDKIIVTYNKDFEGNDVFIISDYLRRDSLLGLFLLFIVLVVIIAKWQGITSLLSMAISFMAIFIFILPKILAGSDPLTVVLTASLFIIPTTFYLAHGFNKKTTAAIFGTLISLAITGLLAYFFIEVSKLSGFASEEAGFLQVATQGLVNIKGLLLAGVIIGALGVLDDVSISQSAIVNQLNITNPNLGSGELYKKAMNVGRDHIASMINTLVLVYTGAALPLLLLFINNPHPFSEVVNYEIIAEEIIRTLVGSIGLILAVPITTLIAAFAVSGQPHKDKKMV